MLEDLVRVVLIVFVLGTFFIDPRRPIEIEDQPKCTKTTSLPALLDAIQKDPSECHQEAKAIIQGLLCPLLLLYIVTIFIVVCWKCCARKARLPEKTIQLKTNGFEYIPESVSVPATIYQTKLSIYSVHVVTNPSVLEDFIYRIRSHCEDFPVIGFDCEWWSIRGPRRQVALLQLASGGGLCILVRLCQMRWMTDKMGELNKLLKDERIIKVGVEPSNDGNKLWADYGLLVKSTLDLRHLARRLNVPEPHKLAALAEREVGLKMDTDWRIPASNWEQDELSADQIEYASKDAIAGLEVFRSFNRQIPMSEMVKYYDSPYSPYR